jgi:hypothetical protein
MNLDYFVISSTVAKNICYYTTGKSYIVVEWRDQGSFLRYRTVDATWVSRDGKRELQIVMYGTIPATGSTTYAGSFMADKDGYVRIAVDADVIPQRDSVFMKDDESRILPIPHSGLRDFTGTFPRFSSTGERGQVSAGDK